MTWLYVPALGRLAPVHPCKSAGARRAITLLDLLGELAPALPVTCHLPDVFKSIFFSSALLTRTEYHHEPASQVCNLETRTS